MTICSHHIGDTPSLFCFLLFFHMYGVYVLTIVSNARYQPGGIKGFNCFHSVVSTCGTASGNIWLTCQHPCQCPVLHDVMIDGKDSEMNQLVNLTKTGIGKPG